ncbi:MAG: hypothetical protein EA411_04100 [Saprospirales bacterium]|nr:MAG: hypothetical protein EA411_04100 [Saprospirales bacterium]
MYPRQQIYTFSGDNMAFFTFFPLKKCEFLQKCVGKNVIVMQFPHSSWYSPGRILQIAATNFL